MEHRYLTPEQRKGRNLVVGVFVVAVACVGGLLAFLLVTDAAQGPEPSVESESSARDKGVRHRSASWATAESEPDLRLIGTSVSSDPAKSRATVIDVNTGARHVLAIGDNVDPYRNSRLREVRPGSATFDHNGDLEGLELDRSMPRVTQEDLRHSYVRQMTRFATRGELYDGLNAVQWMHRGERDRLALEHHANFAPYYEPPTEYRPIYPHGADADRPMEGALVNNVLPNSFYDELGLQDGDIVQQINDVEFDSPEAFQGAFDELVSETSFEVTVIRDGETTTFDVDTMPPREAGEESPADLDDLDDLLDGV